MNFTDKGQGAIEFIAIMGAVLFFFIIFFVVVSGNLEKKNLEKERIIAQSVALDLQTEIELATKSSEGYYREFSLPLNILGKDYDINISGSRVYVSVGSYGISYKVLEVNGSVVKGQNVIRKQNRSVFLN
jgi:hypothetical protein